MNKVRPWVPFLLACLVMILPLTALAAGGLVPCDGIDCQACSLVSLLQKLINFAIGLSIPIAMALFAWAGILYFTSAANGENLAKARNIFKSVLIGFVISLSAYLVVETLLHIILKPEYFANWNTVKCVSDRPTDKELGDLLGEIIYPDPPKPIIKTNQDCLAPYEPAGEGICKYAANGVTTYTLAGGYACPAGHLKFIKESGKCSDENSPPSLVNPEKKGTNGAGLTYQSGIASQIGTASQPINDLIACMGRYVSADISSISDSKIISGQKKWGECRAGGKTAGCAHTNYSCHYGGTRCEDKSYAIDIVTKSGGSTYEQIRSAALQCQASFVLQETSPVHMHVSVGKTYGCGCDD